MRKPKTRADSIWLFFFLFSLTAPTHKITAMTHSIWLWNFIYSKIEIQFSTDINAQKIDLFLNMQSKVDRFVIWMQMNFQHRQFVCMAKQRKGKKNDEQCEIRTTLLQMTSWTERNFMVLAAMFTRIERWTLTVATSSVEIALDVWRCCSPVGIHKIYWFSKKTISKKLQMHFIFLSFIIL